MSTPLTPHRCPACRQADMVEANREKHFYPNGEQVTVQLRISRCPACGAELIDSQQRKENLLRLKARKVHYKGLLIGEEILALRVRYGITQQNAARIFGRGKIAFSRYENEASYPDAGTTKLLKLAMEMPAVIKKLADDAGVELPLWEARCADERKAKVSKLELAPASAEVSETWRRINQTRERRGKGEWVDQRAFLDQLLSNPAAANDNFVSSEAQVA